MLFRSSYSLISFLDLPSESKRLFHNSLSEFADVEYNRCGVTTGDIEILVPVGDDDSAIVYGSYLIECSVE